MAKLDGIDESELPLNKIFGYRGSATQGRCERNHSHRGTFNTAATSMDQALGRSSTPMGPRR